ncbi:protein adenylyltransferase SelO [Aquisalinus flavus]|uniref:Protein nucleotidyltransferase YdiU n=1 Tax=Aquisalinus flavus TaxID=1526572 RepID=A0A8J2Y533_9PROT|nr:YdiU family protein [Aquisalinus flavus]MBD0426499.1 YdiU family protein [Aquisalinus flavus]UNE47949.1 YdiU family protein [Aquisalinus flavus]GGD07479.1 UPF0061 protein [Aquisalinus flavus]
MPKKTEPKPPTSTRKPYPYLALGETFFDVVKPALFPETILRYRNDRAAASVGLDGLSDEDWIYHFAGFMPLPDNLPQPLAMRYHGHQFRSYNADIGDGRGFLFAQLESKDGRLLDLGTKGSGTTPYSRFGDGRLTLKGGVREVLATEMLEALGVYTSKSFSLIETGEKLERTDEPSPTRSAVLVRLSHTHIRFGTFQYLAYWHKDEEIKRLIDYCIEHFMEHQVYEQGEARTIGFYNDVITRSASMVAGWMAAGFVHGVLNTDNMNVSGESFDYGPWRFLPEADPAFTAAYFDERGLYCYGRQPEAVGWNLAQLGGTLTSQASQKSLNAAIARFPLMYERMMAFQFSRRFGVEGLTGDFVGSLLKWMEATRIPFERVFFDWFCGAASEARADRSPHADLYKAEEFKPIRDRLMAAKPVRPERLENAWFDGEPCTMLIDEVEAIWEKIDEDDDWSAFEQKLEDIAVMRKAYALYGPNTA